MASRSALGSRARARSSGSARARAFRTATNRSPWPGNTRASLESNAPGPVPGKTAGRVRPAFLHAMPLRSLLEIATDDVRVGSLAAAARDRSGVTANISASIRPYLLAALLDAPGGLGGAPALIVAADDIAARDLARDLRAYLSPRRVRYYPSRGTGYASHLAPPPHLVGLRIAALDALLSDEAAEEEGPVVVASAVALAEAVPEASLRPAGFSLRLGEEVDLADIAERLVEAGYERIDQVEERGQFAMRGGILDVFSATEDRAARLELFGDEIEQIRWFSTFTQRSLGDAETVELSPAAELSAEHRELAELAMSEQGGHHPPAADGERSASAEFDLAELLPIDRYRAVLDLIGERTAIVVAEDVEGALRDHWDDVTATMPDADARRLYVDVAEPLAERAQVAIS